MGVEPTNERASISGECNKPSTASLSLWSTFNTPSGKPASFHNLASHIAEVGSFSEGLRKTVFPAAIARGKKQIRVRLQGN